MFQFTSFREGCSVTVAGGPCRCSLSTQGCVSCSWKETLSRETSRCPAASRAEQQGLRWWRTLE